MSYKPYYTNGWKSGEAGGTPITPEALNHMENGIKQTYTDLAAKSHGNHVPATQTASGKVFLRNDNTWATVTPANIGAVPTARTVNGKALSANVSLSASDVGAVPSSRTVNGKALSSNVTLTAENVGALPTTGGTMTGDIYIGSETNTANDDLYIRRVVNDVLKSFRIYWNDSGALQLNAASDGTTFNWLRFNTNSTTLSKALSISSGGTGKTTAAEGLAALGGASFTELWKNASPTSAFGSQSISPSPSGYDALLVLARTHITSDYAYGTTQTSLIVPVGSAGLLMDAGESGCHLVTRKVTVTTSKITFAAAKYPSSYANTTLTTGNNNLIPTAVYGIKW